jgi:hypothetical protein
MQPGLAVAYTDNAVPVHPGPGDPEDPRGQRPRPEESRPSEIDWTAPTASPPRTPATPDARRDHDRTGPVIGSRTADSVVLPCGCFNSPRD